MRAAALAWLASVPEAAFVQDAAGVIVAHNDLLARRVGEDVDGRPAADLVGDLRDRGWPRRPVEGAARIDVPGVGPADPWTVPLAGDLRLVVLRAAPDAHVASAVTEVLWSASPGMGPGRPLRLDWVSPRVEALAGVSARELLAGRAAWLDLVDRADRRRVRQAQLAALRGQPAALEHRLRRKDGEMRWVRSSLTPRIEDGRVTALAGVTLDLGSTQRAQQVASPVLRSLATLAGGLAHDINNMMVAVLGHIALLRASLGEHEHAWRLERIFRCAEDAGQLADQLLAYARGGKHRITRTDLNELVAGARALVLRRAMPGAPPLEVDLEAPLTSVEGDPKQLLQVIVALLTNATEAAPHDGAVRISTRTVLLDAAFCRSLPGLVPGRYALLEVADRGCGMDKDTLARCFEPFFSTKERGRGMGLAAAYGIVTNHGGHLAVESAPGVGTFARVYLPQAGAGVVGETTHLDIGALVGLAAPQPSDLVVTPADRRQKTVLLVDDEPLIVEVIDEHLRSAGYRTITARDGKAAVAAARATAGPIDCIVLDLSMPVMDGSDAFPLLQAAHPGAKVVVCSGFDLDASVQRLLDKGAHRFLQKPFRADVLVQTVDELLVLPR